jgi:hypothetical protein
MARTTHHIRLGFIDGREVEFDTTTYESAADLVALERQYDTNVYLGRLTVEHRAFLAYRAASRAPAAGINGQSFEDFVNQLDVIDAKEATEGNEAGGDPLDPTAGAEPVPQPGT